MLTKIKCPKCNTEGTFSISDPVYDGPYRCWKCRELLKIRMEHGSLISVQQMDPQEMAKLEDSRIRFQDKDGGTSGTLGDQALLPDGKRPNNEDT